MGRSNRWSHQHISSKARGSGRNGGKDLGARGGDQELSRALDFVNTCCTWSLNASPGRQSSSIARTPCISQCLHHGCGRCVRQGCACSCCGTVGFGNRLRVFLPLVHGLGLCSALHPGLGPCAVSVCVCGGGLQGGPLPRLLKAVRHHLIAQRQVRV